MLASIAALTALAAVARAQSATELDLEMYARRASFLFLWLAAGSPTSVKQ